VALEIFRFVRERLPAYKRVRRIEFTELPKTISGKIRVWSCAPSNSGARGGERGQLEFREDEFPELRDARAGVPATPAAPPSS
jgi:acetyl-CoA synthetase